MADNFYRSATNGPLLVRVSATGSTVLEVGTRSGTPQTSDLDSNPYTTSGQTRTAILMRSGSGAVLKNTSLSTGVNLTTLVGGQLTALSGWVQENLTTSMAASAVKLANVAGQTQITCPFAGSIVGISGNLTAAFTTGSMRLLATVNGASVFAAASSVTNVRTIYATQAPDVDAVARGDRLGIKVTTSATFTTTLDIAASLWLAI